MIVSSENGNALLVRVSSRLFNTPLMINRAKLDVIMSVIGDRVGIRVPESDEVSEAAEKDLERADLRKGNKPSEGTIESIRVYGTLVQRATGMDAMSGMRSYESIREDFDRAMADPSVEAILFDFDSPGGEVAGCFDLADHIQASRGKKPIFGFANEMAFSAAYALASACDELFLPRTGGVGSIGVIAVHADRSKYDEKAGFAYTHIYAGARKADFSPHHALSEDAAAWLQASVNETYSIFVETVARNRNLGTEDVRKTEAGIFEGSKAVSIGLADGVKTWDQTLAYIQTKIKIGGKKMNLEEIRTGLREALDGEQKAEANAMLETLGYSGEEAVAAMAKTASEKSKEAMAGGYADGVKYAGDLFGVCQLAGMEQMFPELLKKGATIDEARQAVLEAKAKQQATSQIQSTLSATSQGGESDLVAEAKRRAEAAKARSGK